MRLGARAAAGDAGAAAPGAPGGGASLTPGSSCTAPTMYGVTMMTSSVYWRWKFSEVKSLPSTGTSDSHGTL